MLISQASPPPYPGGTDVLSQSPGQASSDFGVDPMEEDEGEYHCTDFKDSVRDKTR